MNRKIYAPILLLILSVMLFSSCYNKHKKVPVAGGIISHFYFKEGSYWVFKDSVSGEQDSLYVDTVTDNYKAAVGLSVDGSQYQTINIVLNELRTHGNIGLFGSFHYRENNVSLYVYSNATIADNCLSFDYPGVISFLNYNVGGQTYPNVRLLQNGTETVFFADDIGLIKLIVTYPNDTTPHVWELLRSSVRK